MSRLLWIVMFAFLGPQAFARGGTGGVDGGGGDFIYNTRNEVIDAINAAWAEVTVFGLSNPMLYGYSYLKGKPHLDAEDKEVLRVFNTIFMVDEKGQMQVDKLKRETEFLRTQKVHLKEDGLCDGPHDKQYLASVTHLNLRGTVCVSVLGLMRLPSASLRFDLIGLLVHEIAHLSGLGEDDARRVQRYMLKNIMKVLRMDGFYQKLRSAKAFRNDFSQHWRLLIRYDEIDEEYVKTVIRLSNRASSERLLINTSPSNSDYIEVARPEARSTMEVDLSNLKADIVDFAEELEDALRSNRKKITARHLQRARKIANKMIELESEYYSHLFGGLILKGEGLRSHQMHEKEYDEIEKVTNPDTLADPADRLENVYCDGVIDSTASLKEQVSQERGWFPERCNYDDDEEIEAVDDGGDDTQTQR